MKRVVTWVMVAVLLLCECLLVGCAAKSTGAIQTLAAGTSASSSVGGGKKTFTVNFDTDGGTPVASQQVNSGGKVQKPQDPQKEGFTAAGWTYGGRDWSFEEDTVTADMTLKVKWQSVSDNGGGNNGEDTPEPVEKFTEKDDLPADLNYKNDYGRPTTVRFLTWIDVEKPDFENDEDSEDDRMSSIYRRNRAVQNRLGVHFDFDGVRGNGSNTSTFVNFLKSSQQSGTNEYDIVATYSRTAGALMANGLLTDINAIKDSYLTVGNVGASAKPWWPQRLASDLSVGSHLFLLTGDMALTLTDEMHCVYFNKELVDLCWQNEARAAGKASGSALLYDYARSGNWTVDKMIELASGNYLDYNNTEKPDYGDRFGLCSVNYCATALYGGAGFRLLERDDGPGLLQVSGDVRSSRLAALVQKLGGFMSSADYYHGGEPGVYYMQPFVDGGCVLGLHYFEMVEDYLIGNERVSGYGVLPLPKYDAQQQKYLTVVGNAFSVFGITYGHTPAEASMLSAVLECWAAESYRLCSSVLLGLNVEKYFEDQESRDMVDVIRSGLIFDLGRLANLNNNADNAMARACENGTSWEMYGDRVWQSMNEGLETFLYDLRRAYQ